MSAASGKSKVQTGSTIDHECFRRIFESAPLAILVADDHGRYVEANTTACHLFGTTREHLIGRQITDFVDANDISPTRTRWQDFRQQQRQSGRFPLVRANGDRRILRYQAVADFVPGLHVSFLEDITEQLASQRARSVAEAERDRIFQVSNDILCIIDGAYRFRRVNPAFKAILGYDEDEVVGRGYLEFLHPDDAGVLSGGERGSEPGSISGHQARFRRKDGAYRWLAWSSRTFDGDHYAVGRDITEAEEARQALAQSEARFRALAESLQLERDLRERFVAALSHDLRSPLTAAKLGAHLILRRADQPSFVETQAARIVRNADHTDQMIQDLLDASRISAGESLLLEPTSCDVTGLVQEVMADQATVYGDRFTQHLQPGVRGVVDRSALRRALENLIGNSIKYGDPHAPVGIKLWQQDGYIHLAVHNLGNPIPPEDQARIFQPYYRAGGGGPTTRGWGLGLTLVRGMATAHGGGVRVDSSAREGTTFTVTLRNA